MLSESCAEKLLEMSCKKVAIVGGGFSGIGALKALKEESIEGICFEKTAEIGGTWLYRSEDSDYESCAVMSTTTLNQSKEMGSISNFPFPEHSPNFMRHDEVYKHVMHICDALDLRKHITCNREVISVKRAADYDETGRWDVTVRNTQTLETVTDTFDAVILGMGSLNTPIMPSYPGLERFRGRVMHTQKLKTFESFAGEHVVVVGTGCSALDAAVEISNVAKQVYWSVRSPSWIITRTVRYGLPMDYTVLRRYIVFCQSILPITWQSKIIQHIYFNTRFNHRLYGIEPEYPVLCKDPPVSDHISSKLGNGTVVLRKNIQEVGEDYVVFEGESKRTHVDTIIMGTGYSCKVPFLEKGNLVEKEKGKILLYKCVFPANLKHPTLAFMAYCLPFGPGFPIGELQSRWIAHVFSGKGSLPSEEEMMKDIEKRYQTNAKRYPRLEKMSVRVDFVQYLDELALEIGAKPNFWKMAFTDPRLFFACVFGPCVSYQYRLVGPHKWDGARKAILTAPQRMKEPLRRGLPSSGVSENYFPCKLLLAVVAACLLFASPNDFIFSAVFFLFSALLVTSVGGRWMFYVFLPLCLVLWLWFTSYLPYVLIPQALLVLACN